MELCGNQWLAAAATSRCSANKQEEIRFVISPELICCRLFAPALLDHEAIVVTGAPRNRIMPCARCAPGRRMTAVPCKARPGRPSGDAMPVLCCCDRHAAWG